MKKDSLIAALFFSLALILLVMLFGASGTENLYDSVIRIHVLANSDSAEDQNNKLLVRDHILEYAKENLKEDSRQSAEEALRENLSEMEKETALFLKESGIDLPVKITLSEEYYPQRDYEALSLPSGTYLSLRVLLGKAEGKNWWCVLFPPLCLDSATEAEDALLQAGMQEENVKTVTKNGTKYKIRFKVIDFAGKTYKKMKNLF